MLKHVIDIAANLLERPFRIGSVIEHRYEVMNVLGRGSYGTSYHVFDQKLQYSVVLKTLRIHKRLVKSGKRSFKEEQKLLQSLDHSYFPTYFENGYFKKIPFFTMEYVSGKTFEQLIFQEEKTYSEKESFLIGVELLHIIDWLHQHGIVHRDIRIPNVMLDHGQLRLIDFGLARRFEPVVPQPFDRDQIKKMVAPISDFYALGHFLLFLLYSTYENNEDSPEQSWEEELQLSTPARSIIRKLLAIDEPYQSCSEIEQDFITI